MIFDKLYYNENNQPSEIELICEKCNEHLIVQFKTDIFFSVNNDYCNVKNGGKILCKCGNRCQSGIIYAKEIKQSSYFNIIQINNSQQQSNIPHCPTCGSTNIKSIYEIFSSWDPKQFKCNNCGYKW